MENKFWETFKKLAGGLTVTLSVFFLLLAVSFFKETPQFVTTSLQKVAGSPLPEVTNDDSLITGKFNPETDGNVVYSYGDNKLFHYKAINNSAFINLEKTPRLMLEITDSQGKKSWKKTDVSWIDTQQGTLFFHFKTVAEDGSTLSQENFTGNYQVILE